MNEGMIEWWSNSPSHFHLRCAVTDSKQHVKNSTTSTRNWRITVFDSTIELRFCIFDRWSDRSKCSYLETGLDGWIDAVTFIRDVIFRNFFHPTLSFRQLDFELEFTTIQADFYRSKAFHLDVNRPVIRMRWPYSRGVFIFFVWRRSRVTVICDGRWWMEMDRSFPEIFFNYFPGKYAFKYREYMEYKQFPKFYI